MDDDVIQEAYKDAAHKIRSVLWLLQNPELSDKEVRVRAIEELEDWIDA